MKATSMMKMTRLSIVFLLSALGLSIGHANARADAAIDFIHLSDTHVIEKTDIRPDTLPKDIEQKQTSGARLARFLSDVPRRQHIQFFADSGDAVDGYAFRGNAGDMIRGQIQHFRAIVSKSPVPFYVTLGNHDLTQYLPIAGKTYGDQSTAGEARAAWVRTIPEFSKGTYYSVEKVAGETRYLFLFLDNGFYGGPLDGSKLTDRSPRVQHLDYEQLYWLQGQLQSHPADVPVLVMHIPLTDDEMSHQIEGVLRTGTKSPLVLALVGHLHVSSAIDDIPLRDGQSLIQVHTTAFFMDSNNWRRIRMTKDCIWISRTDDHLTAQRVVKLDANAAECPSSLNLP